MFNINSNGIDEVTVQTEETVKPTANSVEEFLDLKESEEKTEQILESENTPESGASKLAEHQSKADQLSVEEQKKLTKLEKNIRYHKHVHGEDFRNIALACFMIQRDKLYREYPSQAAYFKIRFGLSRSHSLRLAQMGAIIFRLSVSPTGDTVKLLVSDAHFRPLLKLTEQQQDEVLGLALRWAKMAKQAEIPAKMLAAAVTFLYPPLGPRKSKESARTKLAAQFEAAVESAKAKLPAGVDPIVTKSIEELEQEAKEITRSILSSTGIAWTMKTWNPLHGCTRCSPGCDNCYAAKQCATRLADVYPGLADKRKSTKGKITYAFNGTIVLAPEELAEPLLDHVPKMIFVNSMSDLFHKGVPEEFIEAVFTVMEKAHWHTFQVLTKRPERMAKFTQKRYADKAPPKNIWLGTSTEDQATYDVRRQHLMETRAAVRWLSVEPLLGPINFGSMEGLDWIVVGGESGPGARPMAKVWATDIRDACQKAGVPFFFKQWGAFSEAGKKEREKIWPATLDGVVHHAYPQI